MRLDRDRLPTKKSTVGELLSKTTTVERRRRGTMTSLSKQLCRDLAKAPHDERLHSLYYSRPILKCLENVGFISQLIRKKRCDHEVSLFVFGINHLREQKLHLRLRKTGSTLRQFWIASSSSDSRFSLWQAPSGCSRKPPSSTIIDNPSICLRPFGLWTISSRPRGDHNYLSS